MHTDKAGIYVDAHKLRRVLYQALFDMDKRDRVVFGERAMTELGEFIAAFAMAYDFPEERDYYIRKILKTQYHCELHPRKFYCQHWSKGVGFIGSFIRRDRLYADRRIIRNFRKCIYEFNKCVRRSRIETFMASMNSYIGILKNRNGRGIVEKILKEVNPKWWEYVHYNPVKVCLSANDGYRHVELLSHKYNLRYKKYDK